MDNINPERMRQIEAYARDIGHLIGSHIGGKVDGKWQTGFALLIFSFQGPEFTYISNAQREDMIKTLEEFTARLRQGPMFTSEEKN